MRIAQRRAQRTFGLNGQGALAEAEKEFRLKTFPECDALLLKHTGAVQGPAHCNEYLQFAGDVEKIKIVVLGKASGGSAVQSTAKIGVISYQPKTKLSFPLDGTWYISNARRCFRFPSLGIGHEFAYDFVKVDEEGNSGNGDETKPESYYAYGQSVLAPADGTVYETRDEISDTPMAQLADDDPSVVNRKLAAYQTELRSVTAFVARTANYIIIVSKRGLCLTAELKSGLSSIVRRRLNYSKTKTNKARLHETSFSPTSASM